MFTKQITTGILATAAALTALPAHAAPTPEQEFVYPTKPTLIGRSILPTETYVPNSEPSGFFAKGSSAVAAPFKGQPVQGFSGTHRYADGSYLVLSDNGFGAKGNSQDYLLSVHHIKPNTKTGKTAYLSTPIVFTDPNNLISWPIWRDGGCTAANKLPEGYTCPTADRKLTGWDFDVESMQISADGSIWVGEEFGPYLLHFDKNGVLVEAPIATPGVKAPQNPTLADGEKPNLRGSRGYEGMAISPDGKTLFAMLEGATAEDKAAGLGKDLRTFTVDIATGKGRFTGEFLRYRMESEKNAIGDFIAINDKQGLVIERDSKQHTEAAFKKVYLVSLDDTDGDGYMSKELVVDLLNIHDPLNIGGEGTTFRFPYFTIEDIEIISGDRIAIMNDNNFPATGGRGKDVADVNEYIEIRLPKPLSVDPRVQALR